MGVTQESRLIGQGSHGMILHAVGLTLKINEKPMAQNSVPWLRGSPNGFGILLVQTPLPMGLHIPRTNQSRFLGVIFPLKRGANGIKLFSNGEPRRIYEPKTEWEIEP